MITFQTIRIILFVIFFLLSIPIFKAMIGAPFVPTPKKTMFRMFEIAKLQKGQILYDLGCGDGRFVRFASRQYGARAFGIELNPFLFLYSKIRSSFAPQETIVYQDLAKTDLREADVVICYLLPKTMHKIEDKLNQDLKKGARVISHGFKFKHWEPIETLLPNKKEYGKIYVFEKC